MASTRYSPAVPGHGTDSTADPNANRKTRDTLFYLQKISGRGTKNLITGQFFGGYANTSQAAIDSEEASNITALVTLTGKTPGLVDADYLEWLGVFPSDYSKVNALLIKYANAGSLIQVSYHPYNPWTLGNFHDQTGLGPMADLIDPSKAVYARWISMLDGVAAGLAALQAAGVTVLWRPMMEFNGTWFWWCANGPGAYSNSDFIALWRHMFNYFTNVKGLHNLLWVYSPNSFTAAATSALPFYPGRDYVDIVGMDDYHDPINFPEYDGFVAFGKPVAYCERGPNFTDGNSQLFVNMQPSTINRFPCTTYFMAYSDGWSMAQNQGASALMNSPYVANQDTVAAVMTSLASLDDPTARLGAVLA